MNLNLIQNISLQAQSLSNLILVTPEDKGLTPQNGAPRFLFNYNGEQVMNLKSDITDHYVEDNSAINDQISLTPETFKTSGFIGELNNVIPPELREVRVALDKALLMEPYTPGLTATALAAWNTALNGYRMVQVARQGAVSKWIVGENEPRSITGSETQAELEEIIANNQKVQGNQQTAFQQLYGYWRSRTLFTVQTPWAVFENMAIMDITATQSGDTIYTSNFEVTFKIMRFAQTDTTMVDLQTLYSERVANQAADQQESFKNLTQNTNANEGVVLPGGFILG